MARRWSARDMPDLSGVDAVVTGANSGLGLATTRELARAGARVVMGCRDPGRAAAARERLLGELPEAHLEAAELDLADLASVRAFAQRYEAEHDRLDLLINNAGIMAVPRALTADGFESQLGTNHLGHFALTGLLLDRLRAAPRPRVVSVASVAHRVGRMRFDDLMGERRYGRWTAYGQSKLANLLFTFELERRASAAGWALMALAAHPGYAATNLQTAGKTSIVDRVYAPIANRLIAQSAEQGALPSLYAATAPDLPGGSYVGPDGLFESRGHPRLTQASAHAYNAQDAARLWAVSEQLTGVSFPLDPVPVA